MHSNPSEIITHQFAFACMNASTNLYVEGLGRIDDRAAATDRACRSVEAGEDAVAGHVDFAAAVGS
jgi:hypothetical protein